MLRVGGGAGAVAAMALVLGLAPGAPSSAQTPRPATSPVVFWENVGDTTLQRLLSRSLDANRDLWVAEAREREARASRFEAALDLAPAITADAGYSRQRQAAALFPGGSGAFPDQSVWDAGLRMSWEVDVFGRLRNSLSARGRLVASAAEDVRDVQTALVAAVAGEYFDLRGAQDRLAVARRNADNQRRTVTLTEDRLELGRGSAVDSERAQAQLSSTLAIIPALESEIVARQHRLSVLLGEEPGAPVPGLSVGAMCRAELPEPVTLAAAREAVRERPDVRSAEEIVAAERALVGAAKADYLPRVSLNAAAGYTTNAFDRLGATGTPRYAIGPVVSWPFLDIGRVRSRVDAARANEVAARARYEQRVLTALAEVETAVASYARALERLEHLEAAAAASDRATELARLRFEEGAADFLEVLDAQRRQLEAQDLAASGCSEATGWLVSLYQAVGGSWQG